MKEPTYKTKKEALEACLELWNCIRDNKYLAKERAYLELGIPLNRDLNYCPACEFTAISYSADCRLCPIWPSNDAKSYTCETSETPYKGWLHAANEGEVVYYASKMVELIENSIEKEE